jgi:TRAP-type mannitol/chloroaromatic compound transport system substrate-binding protein
MRYGRTIISAALAVTLGSVAIAAAAAEVNGPNVAWRFSTWGKQRAFTDGIEYVAEQVAKKTGGKFTIKIGYGEQFSKARENLDSIKLGAIDGAHFCNFYHPGKNPAFMVFTLPFLPLGDWDASVAARDRLYQHPALIKDMDQWNAMIYASTLLPQYEFLGKGDPPQILADWKGKRVRAGGGIGDAMQRLGAIKTTTTATEVYTSMQRGSMDAASFPYTYAQAAYKIHEVSDWFTANMSPGTSDCPIVFNKNSYGKLPAQYKKLLQDLRPKTYKVQVQAYKDIDAKNLPMFEKKLKAVRYSDAQLAEFRRIAGKPVWDKWVADNKDKFDGQELIDLVLKTAAAATKK